MLARQRAPFPRVHEEHVIFDRARQWQIGGVRNVGAGHAVVTRAQNEPCLFRRNGKLGDCPESHAPPMVVVPAPRRHTVEVADILDLGQRHEPIPGKRERIVDETADLEPPRVVAN